tara:strand:+ start:498 stop:1202 length:705 start_codon:yes stop_codon:yes gene_type:complete
MGGGKFLSTLKKASATAADVLSTKGDILSRTTSALGRLPVSTNNFSLLCDSAQALGIKWGASATSTLTTAGDLLYASGANTLARLAKGDDNQILKMNGTALNWEDESAGGATISKLATELGSAFNTTSTSFVDVTGLNFAVPDNAGSFMATLTMCVQQPGANNGIKAQWVDGTTAIAGSEFNSQYGSPDVIITACTVGDNDGQTLKIQVQASSGTMGVRAGANNKTQIKGLAIS